MQLPTLFLDLQRTILCITMLDCT